MVCALKRGGSSRARLFFVRLFEKSATELEHEISTLAATIDKSKVFHPVL